ncbi:MAG TPA: AraC family transcriptional regulator [Fimbriimonas sp.]|nr:AraC family transcriptional regulator [Fimbriimonas sp.]
MVPRLSPGSFFGRKQTAREIGGVRMAEWIYSPSYSIPSHSHETAYFGLVLQGTYTEDYGRKTRYCKPATLLYHPSDEVHSEVHDEITVRVLSIELPSQWYEQVPENAAALRSPADFQSGDTVLLASRLYREFKNPDSYSPLAVQGIMLELLASTCRRSEGRLESQVPGWLKRAKEIIRDTHSDGFSLHDIAREAGVHPVHLSRTFRQHYRCTVGEYVRRLRTEEACRALSNSPHSLAEIAISLGYSDQSHFTTAFKRQTGMPPARYRRQCRVQR